MLLLSTYGCFYLYNVIARFYLHNNSSWIFIFIDKFIVQILIDMYPWSWYWFCQLQWIIHRFNFLAVLHNFQTHMQPHIHTYMLFIVVLYRIGHPPCPHSLLTRTVRIDWVMLFFVSHNTLILYWKVNQISLFSNTSFSSQHLYISNSLQIFPSYTACCSWKRDASESCSVQT